MGEKKTKREIKFHCKGVSFSPAFVGGKYFRFPTDVLVRKQIFRNRLLP